jgi:hypothetical protein
MTREGDGVMPKWVHHARRRSTYQVPNVLDYVFGQSWANLGETTGPPYELQSTPHPSTYLGAIIGQKHEASA